MTCRRHQRGRGGRSVFYELGDQRSAGGKPFFVGAEGFEVQSGGDQEGGEAFEKFTEQFGREGAQKLGAREAEGTRVGHGEATDGGERAEVKIGHH